MVVIAKRNSYPYLFASAVGSGFLIAWISKWLGDADVNAGGTVWITTFVWLFAVPATLFSIYSFSVTTPYIELVGQDLQFCSMNTPWKITNIPASDVLEISTYWIPHTTRCMITLRLSDAAYRNAAHDWTWVKRSNGWVYFHLGNSSTNPHMAAKTLAHAINVTYTIEELG